MAKTADVFISYSREDKDSVLSLAAQLREAGVSLWIDQGSIDGAAMWGEEIVNALENAKVLLLMVSEKSVNSHNVVKEVVLASERKEHILPVHLEPTRIPAGLKYPLAGIQHIEYFQGDPAENLRTILRSLERIGVELRAPKQPSPAASPPAPAVVSHSMHSAEDIASFGEAIAVLPFENMSSDKDSDYFSDGLTDELITNLSKIAELEVVSRILSVKYKGTQKDLPVIGRELHARYLVAGSVRKHQDNLRISAQLIDIATGRELWAEKYKGTMEDVFDIQENVSSQIAEALKIKLSPTEKVVLTKRATIVPEAFDCCLKAKYFIYRATKTSLHLAIELLQQALKMDPRYADAYAGLAFAYALQYQLYQRNEEFLEQAISYSLKALMYDRSLPDAHAALGLAYISKGQFDEAIVACNNALELDNASFFNHYVRGRVLEQMGRTEDAIVAWKECVSINPKFHVGLNSLRMAYEMLGRKTESRTVLEQLVSVLPEFIAANPDDIRARVAYALNLAQLGHTEEARRQVGTILELSPNDSMVEYYAACLYVAIGDHDQAVNSLKHSIHLGWKDVEYMKRDPDLDLIREHPEYVELMKGR